jgi:hypothetical protein
MMGIYKNGIVLIILQSWTPPKIIYYLNNYLKNNYLIQPKCKLDLIFSSQELWRVLSTGMQGRMAWWKVFLQPPSRWSLGWRTLQYSIWKPLTRSLTFTGLHGVKNKTNSVAWVRERTIPTERPPPLGDVNVCG